ncbi:phospholipase A2 [Cryptotermes secundus]|uniref:phospholipase A2 n=1 Tax=Cryptotermes secundus TaxID=105785 RepID=UPI000CD7C9C6|nr:phospholipase A2 [Cryptotermes secundus]
MTTAWPHRSEGWSIAWKGGLKNDPRFSLIFPGTKWCGSGNIAANFADLGSSEETDKCCREHDNCPDSIEAWKSKHNLTNNSFYTRLHCKCDDEFYYCLKKNNDFTSMEVGITYFDVLGTQCYKKEYPIISCKKYNRILMSRCELYELNETLEKQWQWFDVPVY